MGAFEVAKQAGVTPQAVSNWVVRRPDFPAPLAQLASGPVWDASAIRSWLAKSGVTVTKRTEHKMASNFQKGVEYTLDEVRAVLGGDPMSYLPQAGGRIVYGKFTTKMNPSSPYEVLVGDPPQVQRKAELLAQQRGVLPVFMKEGPNRWRFHGPMEFVDYAKDPSFVEAKARAAGREGQVAGLLVFRDHV